MVRWSSLLALVAGATITLAAGSARADGNIFDDCGGAVFNGNESCTAEVSGGCSVACSPPNLQIACDASLEASCSGGCTGSVSASCTGSCSGSCMGMCSSTPGEADCNTNCNANCSGSCTGSCMGSSNMETCMGQCNASCSARCNTSCKVVPPMATCSGECMAACQGSCTAQANASCDINCQAMGSASCTTSGSIFNNCNASCNAKTAIFCNGNFINAADANDCANDLKSLLNIQITGWSYAESSASCDGGTCTAQAAAGAGGSVSCDMAPAAPPVSGALLGIGLGATAIGFVRRRRAGKKAA
jgi:hypothetical protein